MPRPPVLPAARLGLFTTAEAYVAGWDPGTLGRAVRRGELIRWRRGVFSPAWSGSSDVTTVQRADTDLARAAVAGALTTPAAVVGHLAAAHLRGWPVWAPRPRPCVVVDDNRSRVPGLHVHRTPVGRDAATTAGYRYTHATRTVLDIACEFGAEAGLVVADAALARGDTDPARLRRVVEAGRGRTGISAARLVAELADHRAESPLESRCRWACVQHGLPRPEPQVVMRDGSGALLGRVDLFWAVGVVVEVDGLGKLADAGVRRALTERHRKLERAGARVIRVIEADLRDFGPTAAWVREELAAAAADPRPRGWHATST